MKKQTLLFVLLLHMVLAGEAQLVKKTIKEKPSDWYNLSFDKEGAYGAEVNKAYEFLKEKAVKKKPVVAVIGYGMDDQHEDLKKALWTNSKEKEDGVDNDKNGWVDDLNGWNFLGSAKGDVVDKTLKEGDREYLRLKGLYGGIVSYGGIYYRFDEVLQKPITIDPPANVNEYKYFSKLGTGESQLAKEARSYDVSKFSRYYVEHDFTDDLKKVNPDLSKITEKDLNKINTTTNGKPDTLKLLAKTFFAVGWNVNNNFAKNAGKPPIPFPSYKETYLKSTKSKDNLDKALTRSVDTRKIVGDDWTNINQKNYGNNILYTSNAFSGTMISGIIAAERNNNIGVDGIMPDAQLMSLRVFPKEGEPYYKDIALAIHYAVDNNADVIQLCLPNTLYPDFEAKWVNDALLYAEKKGALVVAPVFDASHDISVKHYYPNKHIGNKVLNNFITVAAADSAGMPHKMANYSATEMDLFAPGVNITTTYMGDTYRKGTSSMLAAACVTGTAALIKAYYPTITGSQLRQLILNNVTLRDDVEVEKNFTTAQGNRAVDMFLFKQLCVSGGILNAYKAVIAADKLGKKGK